MKSSINLILVLALMTLVGCETMEKGAHKTGEYTGKAARVPDKVSEGALDSYIGTDTTNNPYNR